jgi:hypothetical protein
MKKEESISYLLQRSMPLTNRMGVYVGLNTKYNDVVYIGKAQDYWKRTPDSLEKKIKLLQDEECKDYGCDNITFIPCNTMKETDEKERELIKFWKPYYNQQHNIGYFMNNYNKRLRDILREELGRHLHTYEIMFSNDALNSYYHNFWNPYKFAKSMIINHSNIGDNITNEGEKWKKINKTARYLNNIIKIHYEYLACYQERTEEKKESMRRSLKENENEDRERHKQNSTLNIIPLKTLRYGN